MGAFTVGLDLGQGRDFSALVAVEWVRVLPPGVARSVMRFAINRSAIEPRVTDLSLVRHLQRWELGTPYPQIVSDVASMLRTGDLRDAVLVVDRTGVGRAVWDMINAEYMDEEFGCFSPVPVTITAGEFSGASSGTVPKADLVAALQVPLEQGRVRVAGGLALAPVLEKELLSFRHKLTASGRASVDVQRRAGEGHGDLATALMLAMLVRNTIREPREIEHAELG